MHYEIEVNVARRGAEPMWQSLVDDNAEACRWDNGSDARAALVAEDRGENARLFRYDNSGVGRVFPVFAGYDAASKCSCGYDAGSTDCMSRH